LYGFNIVFLFGCVPARNRKGKLNVKTEILNFDTFVVFEVLKFEIKIDE
jgi:hypothetical protein